MINNYIKNTFEIKNEIQFNTDPDDIDFKGSRGIIKKNLDSWIKAHEKKYQEALFKLSETIEHITYNTFKKQLIKSMTDFNKQVTNYDVKGPSILLVEPNKSNQWVAEVAYQFFNNKPDLILELGEKKAEKFITWLNKLDNIILTNKTGLFPGKIYLCDDGSYSGKQITLHAIAILECINEIISNRGDHIKLPHLFIIIPYMTDESIEFFKNKCLKKFQSNVHFASHATIPTLSKVLDEEHVKLLNELWFSKEENSPDRGVYLFDHKIPNYLSFFTAFCEPPINRDQIPKKELILKKLSKKDNLEKREYNKENVIVTEKNFNENQKNFINNTEKLNSNIILPPIRKYEPHYKKNN